MALRRYVYLVLVAFAWWLLISAETGCANIIPPTGGPRDSLPPVLISATPKDSTLRFQGNRIVLNFDEFVDVQQVSENLIVSPTPKTQPTVEFRLKTVTIRIKDTLQPNTTYALDFGNAIRDINENNVLKNFTYVFSTGTFLDNRELGGSVVLAESGKVDSTMIVMLHQSGGDSAVAKERPRYYTRLDGAGRFRFRNLPAGRFYLYALKDESGTRRYESRSQLFAFANAPVQISDSSRDQKLYAYAEPEEALPKARPAASTGKKNDADRRLAFTTNLESDRQDLLDSFRISFPSSLKTFDTTGINFTDITYRPFPGIRFYPDSMRMRFAMPFAWKPDSTYHLILNKGFAEDSTGKSFLRSDTITFKAKKETDYGNVKLRFPGLDLSRHPVLQFTQNEEVKLAAPMTSTQFNQRLFKPGDYNLRILFDTNQNGVWDPGSFFGVHRQPEMVQPLTEKLTVKANWDTEKTINQ